MMLPRPLAPLLALYCCLLVAMVSADCTVVAPNPSGATNCLAYDFSPLTNQVLTVTHPEDHATYLLGGFCGNPQPNLPADCANVSVSSVYQLFGAHGCYPLGVAHAWQLADAQRGTSASSSGFHITLEGAKSAVDNRVRSTKVTVKCDPKATPEGTLTFTSESPTLVYNFAWTTSVGCAEATPVACPAPSPFPKPAHIPKPTKQQLALMDMGLSQFKHYSVNPFAPGDVKHNCVARNEPCISKDLFNPTDLSTDEWVATAAAFGAGEVCLTAHHEGGFCLWDSQYCRNYTSVSSPCKCDIVDDFIKSCKKYNVRPCFYIGPNANGWLWYNQKVSAEEFISLQLNQYKELVTKYDIARFWWDHYPSVGTGRLNPAPPSFNYTTWFQFVDLVRELSPDTIICPGPDCSGHLGEKGTGSYPVWFGCTPDASTMNLTCSTHGPTGTHFHPLETCVSPQPGWFASGTGAGSDTWTVEDYWYHYLNSVGIGYINTINAAPGTTGQDPPDVVAVETEFGQRVIAPLNNPIASTSKSTTGPCASMVIEVDVSPTAVVNVTMVREDLTEGQRIAGYKLDYMDASSGVWMALPVRGITVGPRVIDQFSGVSMSKLRFTCTETLGDPVTVASVSAHMIDVTPTPNQSL